MKSSAEELKKNFTIVTIIRIVTPVVDLISTTLIVRDKNETSWLKFAMGHASTVNFISLAAEKKTSRDKARRRKKIQSN